MNTTLTYIIFYTYFILSKDMKKKKKKKKKKTKKNKQTKTKNDERHANGLSKQKYA